MKKVYLETVSDLRVSSLFGQILKLREVGLIVTRCCTSKNNKALPLFSLFIGAAVYRSQITC
jgi:hypothetical protein